MVGHVGKGAADGPVALAVTDVRFHFLRAELHATNSCSRLRGCGAGMTANLRLKSADRIGPATRGRRTRLSHSQGDWRSVRPLAGDVDRESSEGSYTNGPFRGRLRTDRTRTVRARTSPDNRGSRVTDARATLTRKMEKRRPPLSELEAARIGYSPSTHRTCQHCGHVVQDIARHHKKHHSGTYMGPLRDADDPTAQPQLRRRR